MYEHFAPDADEQVTFTIDDDPFIFVAEDELTPMAVAGLQLLAEADGDPDAVVTAAMTFLQGALTEGSWERLHARYTTPGPDAIDSFTLGRVAGWLTGQLLLREQAERSC